jgi:hypothetical protein
MNGVAALAEPHLLRETGELIEIGRKIGDPPNS